MTDKREDNTTPIIIDPRLLQGYYHQDDEISLVDLWLTLVKQKHIFFITLLICILLALLYVLAVPKTYEYKTVITIGTQAQAQAQQLIERPDSVKANLENVIIPKVLMQQHLEQPENKLDVTASIPKNSTSIVLSSKGTLDQEQAVRAVHQQLINMLQSSHQRKTAPLITYLKEELDSTRTLLDKLKQQQQHNDSEALALQIINTENLLHETKLKLALFSETRSDMGTVRSVKPVNKSGRLILAVSIVLGLFAGIFAALFAGFLANIKKDAASSTA